MSIVREMFERVRETVATANIGTIVKSAVSQAYLNGDSQRDFLKELYSLTQHGPAFATVETYSTMAWRCVRNLGGLAEVWQTGAGISIKDAYTKIPKKHTGRKNKSQSQKVQEAFSKLTLAEKNEILPNLSAIRDRHAAYVEKMAEAQKQFTTETAEV